MAKDDAEEKKFAPTESRMRQLRRDGQVPHSQNFAQAACLLVLLLYLALGFDWIAARFMDAFSIDMFRVGETFGDRAWQASRAVGYVFVIVAAPFGAIAVFVLLLASVVDMRGFAPSAKNVSPNFERLNPVEGLKRLFKMQAAIELAKGVVKTLVIGLALTALGLYSLNALLWSPTCGGACAYGAAKFVIAAALLIAALLLLVFGLADLPVSRFLFRHENRMTMTEYKRDRKESLGDPTMRGARRREGRAILEAGPVSEGLINIVIVGEGVAVGLRFVRGETPAPVTMAKRLGAEGETLTLMARGKGLHVIEDKELALMLGQRAPTGEQVPQAMFDPLARALVRARIL